MQEIAAPISGQPLAREERRPDGQNVHDIERLASALGGGALAIYGLRTAPAGLALTAVGGVLLYRAITGHCPIYSALGVDTAAGSQPVHVERSLTIGVEPGELYRFWRDFENLPRFMDHLEEVRVLSPQRSHWVARGPAGTHIAWDAEIFFEKEDELIAWRSLPDAAVSNAGSVRFRPAPGGRGTELRVVLEYLPPAGKLGQLVARLFGEEPGQQVDDALRRLKMILETGEVATNAMRPAAQEQPA